MNDLISRQAVLDIVDDLRDRMTVEGYCAMVERVKALPSAQPEIVRCNDCLMHGVCRFEQGLGLDGYCSQAERRTDGSD
jgi:hypothetical protein